MVVCLDGDVHWVKCKQLQREDRHHLWGWVHTESYIRVNHRHFLTHTTAQHTFTNSQQQQKNTKRTWNANELWSRIHNVSGVKNVYEHIGYLHALQMTHIHWKPSKHTNIHAHISIFIFHFRFLLYLPLCATPNNNFQSINFVIFYHLCHFQSSNIKTTTPKTATNTEL